MVLDLDGDGIVDEKEMEAAYRMKSDPKPLSGVALSDKEVRGKAVPSWMFKVVAKPSISRMDLETQRKMERVAAFMEKMARGPKEQILSAFKRYHRQKKQERQRKNVASKADTEALAQSTTEIQQMEIARDKADRNRLLQQERRDYKQAVFFRDQVVFFTKKLQAAKVRQDHLKQKVAMDYGGKEQEFKNRMGQQKHMRHVQEIIFLIDKDVQEREEKLQAKHEMEWNYLDQKIEDLKAALPPPPQFGASPGEPLRETAYAPHTIRKRQKERELAVEQKYEQANMMRQQIELDECDAYDELIAKHAAKVEHISDDLAQRQVGEMQRFIESTRRVDDMAPRIVRMCDVPAQEEGGRTDDPWR